MDHNKMNLTGEDLFFYSQNNLGGLSVDVIEKIFIEGIKTYFNQSETSLTVSDEAFIRFSTVLYQETSDPEEAYRKQELGSLLHDLTESSVPLNEKIKSRLNKIAGL